MHPDFAQGRLPLGAASYHADMQCNIDRRGRALRIGLGAIALVGAAACAILGWTDTWNGVWPWIIAMGLGGVGAFGVFEGIRGWCAVRAMGVRTRI